MMMVAAVWVVFGNTSCGPAAGVEDGTWRVFSGWPAGVPLVLEFEQEREVFVDPIYGIEVVRVVRDGVALEPRPFAGQGVMPAMTTSRVRRIVYVVPAARQVPTYRVFEPRIEREQMVVYEIPKYSTHLVIEYRARFPDGSLGPIMRVSCGR